MTRNLYATIARGLALTSSTITSMLVLWSPTSLASSATIDGLIVDALNFAVLLACVVGWSDLVWHDIRGRLIWPSLDVHIRHHICVLLYSALAAAYGMRLFSWADPLSQTNIILGLYYTLQAAFIGAIAVAIATEKRHES